MTIVESFHPDVCVQAFCANANLLQRQLQFVGACGDEPLSELRFQTKELARSFFVSDEHVAFVSAHEFESHAALASVKAYDYLVILALSALVQQRVLVQNPLLRSEDFLSSCHPNCLFATRLYMEQTAQAMRHRFVCDGCRRFYSALGATRELDGLEQAMEWATYPAVFVSDAAGLPR